MGNPVDKPRLALRGFRRLPVWLFLLWSLGSVWTAWGEDAPLVFERYSTDQGLADGSVAAMLEDHQGFLWVGTHDGLNLFDGYTFRTFRHLSQDPNSLSDDHVQVLWEGQDGGLWIGTFRGLNRFDRSTGQFRRFLHDPDDENTLHHDRIHSLHQDRAGTLWVGTYRGLHRVDPRTQAVERVQGDSNLPFDLEDVYFRSIAEDEEGRLWFGTDRWGLLTWDPREDTWQVHSLPEDLVGGARSIRSFFLDSEEGAWVGTDGALLAFDRQTGEFRRYHLTSPNQDSVSVRTIHRDREGRLWLGTALDGLFLVDSWPGGIRQSIHDPDDPQSLSSNRISTIFEDHRSNLWVGTDGGGILKRGPTSKGFRLLTQDPDDPMGLPDNRVRSVYLDRRGVLWVGTEGGLWGLDPDGGQRVYHQQDPSQHGASTADRVTAMVEDPWGTMWFGTRGDGLFRWQTNTMRLQRFRHWPEEVNSLTDGEISALLVDRGGTLWVGTHGGLDRFDHEKEFFLHYRHESTNVQSLSNDRVTSLLEDQRGILWVGTYVGLNELDPRTGAVQRHLREPGRASSLSDHRVWALYEAEPGEIYVGTSGGLHRIDAATGEAVHLPRPPDPRGDVVVGILGDDAGHLWLSSNRGIAKYDPRTGEFTHYGVGDGVQAEEFYPGAVFKSREGEIFFAGNGGLNRFFPGRLQGRRQAPPVVLTAFKKFNREVDLGGLASEARKISLTHQDYFVAFEFAALDFANSRENRYAYKLEGFDEDWVEIGVKRTATYTSLPTGDYIFRVKAANSSGIWNEDGLALPVTVKPPFWESWWFRLAALLTILGLGTLIEHLRTRGIQEKNRELEKANLELGEEVDRRKQAEAEKQDIIGELEERNAEMERFIYTVSHDLKSPLITIRSFVGLIEHDMESGREERVKNSMQRIHQAAGKMTRLLEDLLELSRIGRVVHDYEEVPMGDLVEQAQELLWGRIQETGAVLHVASDLPTVEGDPQRLVEVIQNLLDNAIRFSAQVEEPRIQVGWRRDGSEDVFYVEDNGVGIDPRYQSRIFELFERLDPKTPGTGVGLALVKRIVEVHGGRVWVESEGAGQGARFCWTLGGPEEFG